MSYSGKMKKVELSPEMHRCLELIDQHGRLCRYPGGFWQKPDDELAGRVGAGIAGQAPDGFTYPLDSISIKTVQALLRREYVEVSKEQRSPRGPFPVEVKRSFDNEERHRWYGIRRGDTVQNHFRKGAHGDVIGYDRMDNNRVLVCWADTPTEWHAEVAEYLTIITRVEDKKGRP